MSQCGSQEKQILKTEVFKKEEDKSKMIDYALNASSNTMRIIYENQVEEIENHIKDLKKSLQKKRPRKKLELYF